MANVAILMQILLPLLDRAGAITSLLSKAHSEGRDVTSAELDSLFAADDQAKAALDAAIKAARGA